MPFLLVDVFLSRRREEFDALGVVAKECRFAALWGSRLFVEK